MIPPTKYTLQKQNKGVLDNTGRLGMTASRSAPPLYNETPTFPNSVYDGLPDILKEGCSVFNDKREKDVFLISTAIILSGCMPTVHGVYDGAEVKANLFGFIIAPAGNGKGVVSWSRKMGVGIHKHKAEESERLKSEHDQRAAEARVEKQVFTDLPPPYKCLFIPGNSSSASIVKSLKDNDSNGVICETEADSLSGALKQDWGDFSDVLRKAFHHEVVSSSRKNGEKYEIEHPALSVILAGTPGQVGKLISNAENGLFSRFLFYRFQNEPLWRDVSPVSGRTSLNKHFSDLSERVKDMALHLESYPCIEFSLTDSQWRVFNQFCKTWLEDSVEDTSAMISSTIFRLGLIIYRLAMIMTVWRSPEKESFTSGQLVCDDQSMIVAIDLAKVLLNHGKLMFDTLGMTYKLEKGNDSRQQFLESLPAQFERKVANEVGKDLKVTERTVTNYLERLTALGQLIKDKHGKYRKP